MQGARAHGSERYGKGRGGAGMLKMGRGGLRNVLFFFLVCVRRGWVSGLRDFTGGRGREEGMGD